MGQQGTMGSQSTMGQQGTMGTGSTSEQSGWKSNEDMNRGGSGSSY
jgi:hypothetical protein